MEEEGEEEEDKDAREQRRGRRVCVVSPVCHLTTCSSSTPVVRSRGGGGGGGEGGGGEGCEGTEKGKKGLRCISCMSSNDLLLQHTCRQIKRPLLTPCYGPTHHHRLCTGPQTDKQQISYRQNITDAAT